jgi:uncharacterized membrane protein YkvA (DUF1232 family)
MKKLPNLNTLYKFFVDKETDWKPKALSGLTLLYILWPLDIIPDFPVIGWLDDIGFGIFAGWYLARKARQYEKKHRDT